VGDFVIGGPPVERLRMGLRYSGWSKTFNETFNDFFNNRSNSLTHIVFNN